MTQEPMFEPSPEDRKEFVNRRLKLAAETATAKREKAEDNLEKAILEEQQAHKAVENFIALEGM